MSANELPTVVTNAGNSMVVPTFTTSTYAGYTVKTEDERPVKTPDNFLTTRAIETKSGWVGQIIIFSNIVWESLEAHETEKLALGEVNQHMVGCLASLFSVGQ
jgi:expansin (peptidoglycan-binding protein)